MTDTGIALCVIAQGFERVRCAKGHEYDRPRYNRAHWVSFTDYHNVQIAKVDMGCVVCLAERIQALCEPVEVVK